MLSFSLLTILFNNITISTLSHIQKLLLTLEFWSHNVSLSAIFHLSLNIWYIIIKMLSCTWLTHNKIMMTSSNGNIFRVTGLLCGEFTGPGESPAQRPVTQSFDVFFDLRLNKPLSKQPWGWWFEMLSWSLWRQCDGAMFLWDDTVTNKLTTPDVRHRIWQAFP